MKSKKIKKTIGLILAITTTFTVPVFAARGTCNGYEYEGNNSFKKSANGYGYAYAWTKCLSGANRTMAYVNIRNSQGYIIGDGTTNNYSNTGWVQTEQIARDGGSYAVSKHGYSWDNSFYGN